MLATKEIWVIKETKEIKEIRETKEIIRGIIKAEIRVKVAETRARVAEIKAVGAFMAFMVGKFILLPPFLDQAACMGFWVAAAAAEVEAVKTVEARMVAARMVVAKTGAV